VIYNATYSFILARSISTLYSGDKFSKTPVFVRRGSSLYCFDDSHREFDYKIITNAWFFQQLSLWFIKFNCDRAVRRSSHIVSVHKVNASRENTFFAIATKNLPPSSQQWRNNPSFYRRIRFATKQMPWAKYWKVSKVLSVCAETKFIFVVLPYVLSKTDTIDILTQKRPGLQ